MRGAAQCIYRDWMARRKVFWKRIWQPKLLGKRSESKCEIWTLKPQRKGTLSNTIQRGKGCVFSAEIRHLEGVGAAGFVGEGIRLLEEVLGATFVGED